MTAPASPIPSGLVEWLTDALNTIAQRATSAADEESRAWYVSDDHESIVDDATPGSEQWPIAVLGVAGLTSDAGEHIVTHDPRAVLARVEGERAVVAMVTDMLRWLPQPGSPDRGALQEHEARVYVDVLRWLAWGHRRDIPGYASAWTPERAPTDLTNA